MKPEFKKVWVEALRSGEFKQTKGTLKSPDGYCCLGVACVVWKRAGLADIEISEGDYGKVNRLQVRYGNDPSSYSTVIPPDLIILADLTKGPVLVGMNDNEDKSFSEIADYIEANL